MPLILATAIRTVIQLATTFAIYTTAEAFIKATLDRLPAAVARIFGVTEEEAQDFLHDFMIAQALSFGITALALRKQLPTIVAERLGFTSKGFRAFGLSANVKNAIKDKIGKSVPVNLTKGWGAWSPVIKIMAVITSVWMMTQSVEVFAYRPQFFVNILSFFGLKKVATRILVPPPKPLFSEAELSDHLTAFIQAGAGPISLDYVRAVFDAAEETVRASLKVPTQANVLKVVREDLLEVAPKTTTPTAVGGGEKRPVTRGTIAQGALGERLPFEVEAADEITNFEQLRAVAKDVLTQFLHSIPGNVVYEISLVTSFIDPNGIKRVARAQTQQVGVNADGTPKMKTLLNRIAVVDVFYVKTGGDRQKINRFILGPTDAFKLTTGITQLSALEQEVRAEILELPEPLAALGETTMTPAARFKVGDRFTIWERDGKVLAYVEIEGITDRERGLKIVRFSKAVDLTGTDSIQNPAHSKVLAPGGFVDFRGEPITFDVKLAPTWSNPESGIRAAIDFMDSHPTAPPVAVAPVTQYPRTVTVSVPAVLVRSAPNTAAPQAGIQRMVQGNTFVVTGFTLGETVEGENRWWVSQFGNYVWVGGTTEKP